MYFFFSLSLFQLLASKVTEVIFSGQEAYVPSSMKTVSLSNPWFDLAFRLETRHSSFINPLVPHLRMLLIFLQGSTVQQSLIGIILPFIKGKLITWLDLLTKLSGP